MEDTKSDKEKIQKIKNIIEREIEKELKTKQNEVTDISEKIKHVLRHLDLLKYIVAVNYYDQNTTLTQKKSGQEEENEEEKTQTQIHPCIKKLMPFRSNYNKSFGDFLSSHSYETRNSKKNSSEAVTEGNKETITKSVQEKCQNLNRDLKMPQYIPPLPSNEETVGTVNSTRGSVSKECYRVIVGNISKWIPPDTREDNSTHKWMVYIRNKDPNRDVTQLLKKVRYFLHESYKPHDIIDVTSPPFRLTRRGWGEFPIRVQLHFTHPLNKPIDIIHNLKLDMSCSGIQMLGGETAIEISLHQNNLASYKKDIMKSESGVKDESVKEEAAREKQDVFDGNLITNLNGVKAGNCIINIKEEVDDDEYDNVIIKQEPEESFKVKLLNSKIDEINEALSNSRKYLLDRRKILKTIEIEHNYLKADDGQSYHKFFNNLNPNSILKLESVHNSNIEKKFKNGAVLNSMQANHLINQKTIDQRSKVEVINNRSEEEIFKNLKTATSRVEAESQSKYSMKTFRHMYLTNIIQRAHATKLNNVESLIRWFVQRWPIITKLSSDPTYKTVHPYSSPSQEEFFTYNIGKQRSSEWFRAKAIQKVLKSLKAIVPIEEEIWSTKQILLWSRFHGYTPSLPQKNPKLEARENEQRSKRLKPNESSSESDEESFSNPKKKPKAFDEKFMNGLNITERKKGYRKCRRKPVSEDSLDRVKDYKGCNTCTETKDPERFGANTSRSLQSVSLSEIDILTVPQKKDKENALKKKEVYLSITTTPEKEVLFNNFVNAAAKQIGVKLLEEELIPGVKADSVLRVLSQSVSSFLDELLRRSLAQAWIRNGERCPDSLEVNDVLTTLIEHHRFDIFTNRGLGIRNVEKS